MSFLAGFAQGSINPWISEEKAYHYATFFPRTPLGTLGPTVEIFPRGSCSMMHVEDEKYSGVINRKVIGHLRRAEAYSSEPSRRAKQSKDEKMKMAFDRFLEMEGRPDFAGRDWSSVFSFSIRPKEVIDEWNRRYVQSTLWTTHSDLNLTFMGYMGVGVGGFNRIYDF